MSWLPPEAAYPRLRSRPGILLSDMVSTCPSLLAPGAEPTWLSWTWSALLHSDVRLHSSADVDAIRIYSDHYCLADDVPVTVDFTRLAAIAPRCNLRHSEVLHCPGAAGLVNPHAIFLGEAAYGLRLFVVSEYMPSKTLSDALHQELGALDSGISPVDVPLLCLSRPFLEGLRLELPGKTARVVVTGLFHRLSPFRPSLCVVKFDTKGLFPLDGCGFSGRLSNMLLPDDDSVVLSLDVGVNLTPSIADHTQPPRPTTAFWTTHFLERLQAGTPTNWRWLFPCFCSGDLSDGDFSPLPNPGAWVRRVRMYASVSHLHRKAAGHVLFSNHCTPGLIFAGLAGRSRHVFSARDVKLLQETVAQFETYTAMSLEWSSTLERRTCPARAEFTLKAPASNMLPFLAQHWDDLLCGAQRFAEQAIEQRQVMVFYSDDLSGALYHEVREVSSAIQRICAILAGLDSQSPHYKELAGIASALEDMLRYFFDGQRKSIRTFRYFTQNEILKTALDRGCLSLNCSEWTLPTGRTGVNPVRLKTQMLFRARGRPTIKRRAGLLYDLSVFVNNFALRTKGLGGELRYFDLAPVLKRCYREVSTQFLEEVCTRNGLQSLRLHVFLDDRWTQAEHDTTARALVTKHFMAPIRLDRRRKLDSIAGPTFRAQLQYLEDHPLIRGRFDIATNPDCLNLLCEQLEDVISRSGVQAIPEVEAQTLRPHRGLPHRRFALLRCKAAEAEDCPAAEDHGEMEWLARAWNPSAEFQDAASSVLREEGLHLRSKTTVLKTAARKAGLSRKEENSLVRFVLALWDGHFDSRLKNNIDAQRLAETGLFDTSDDWRARRRHTPDEWLAALMPFEEVRAKVFGSQGLT